MAFEFKFPDIGEGITEGEIVKLHAQEIDFNDIRTTLQALLAIQDNTNSLHTNAYDEAITTPTEESINSLTCETCIRLTLE